MSKKEIMKMRIKRRQSYKRIKEKKLKDKNYLNAAANVINEKLVDISSTSFEKRKKNTCQNLRTKSVSCDNTVTKKFHFC